MTQTVSSAVAVREKEDKVISWLRRQQDDIAMAAASHIKPSAIIRVTQGALRRDEKLMAAAIANPQSLLYALLDAARLGHEPDTDDYYLVPFGNEVTGIEGYKGIIERMYRAGAVSSVVAEVVYQKDVYRRSGPTTPPVHEFDEFADPASRGPLRGVYAYAVMLDGRYSKIVTMGRAEIMRHKAMSKGSDRSDSPWQVWEESMWKKCPLRGLEPYVPTSTEYRTVTARAAAEAASPRVIAAGASFMPPPGRDRDIVDAVVIEEPPVPPAAAARPAAASAPPAARAAADTRPSGSALGKLGKLLGQLSLTAPKDMADMLPWLTGRDGAASLEALTRDETAKISKALDGILRSHGDAESAAAMLWARYHEDTTPGEPEDQADGEAVDA